MWTNAIEVLLVEDDPNDVELTLHALKEQKLANRVEVVRDGADALDYLFKEGRYTDRPDGMTPRVVLLDLKLPKVDGLEVLRRVKADDRTRTIPVVVLTSSREEQDLIDSYDMGVNSFVTKPVDFNQFARAISQLGLYWLILNEVPASNNGRPSERNG